MKYLLVVFVTVLAMTSATAFATPIPIDKARISGAICGLNAADGSAAVAGLYAAHTGSAPMGRAWKASATHHMGQSRPCPLMGKGSTLFGSLSKHCNRAHMSSSGCCLKVPDPVGGAGSGNGLSPDAAIESNTIMYAPGGFIVAENKTFSTTEHLRRIFRPPVL